MIVLRIEETKVAKCSDTAEPEFIDFWQSTPVRIYFTNSASLWFPLKIAIVKVPFTIEMAGISYKTLYL